MNNTSQNVIIEFAGKKQTVSQWEKELGFSPKVIQQRIKKLKWSIEKALTRKKGDG